MTKNMVISDWIAGGALLVSVGSLFVSLRSNSHAKKSAKASEDSAQSARDALTLDKERFNRESTEASQYEKNTLIQSGEHFLKGGGRKGFKRWFHANPELFQRPDWFDIVKKVAVSNGMYFKSEEDFFNFCREYQISLPNIGGNQDG